MSYISEISGIFIEEDESVDDLQYGGLMLIQKKEGFRFGVDSVLLVAFAKIRHGDRVVDLGTGSGIISVLLAGKTPAVEITGLEIQPALCEMASRTMVMNRLEKRVKIVCGDIQKIDDYFTPSCANSVVSNPPYISAGRGLLSCCSERAVSRHEIMCSLDGVIRAAAWLLMPAGRFFMVHRPERLADIICTMRESALEPKSIRFVHPKPSKRACLILIEGIKKGNCGLKMLPPLYIYDPDGGYSHEIEKIYGKNPKIVQYP